MNVEQNIPLEGLVKQVGLCLSNQLSGVLNLPFMCKYFAKKLSPYEAIQKLDRNYFSFSMLSETQSPVLHVLDTQVLYRLTNRILGGEGIAEPRSDHPLFTFSERIIGQKIIGWVADAFNKNNLHLQLDKIANGPRYFHLFLPDEKVWQFAFELYMGSQLAGMYFLCIDRNLEHCGELEQS
ncbi:MAG: hypothetical protein AABZ14_06325 [Candidatus Margulisiibacteriota bacterium]